MEGAVFVIVLLKIMLGSCEETSHETPKETLNNDYEHTFDSLPTLFEYILEMLEDKPEILEKSDVTFFLDSQEIRDGDVKREKKNIDNHLDVDEHNLKMLKRNYVFNYFANKRYATDSMINTEMPEIVAGDNLEIAEEPNKTPSEIQTRDVEFSTGSPYSDSTLPEIVVTGWPTEITTDVPKTVIVPDFTVTTGIPDISNIETINPRNSRNAKSVISGKDSTNYISTEIPEIAANDIIGRVKPKNKLNGLSNVIDTFNGPKDVTPKKIAKFNDKNNKNRRHQKRKININPDSFVGSIDWSKFYLSPEQVEEQALKTELAIEDHNKKKVK